MSYLIFNKVADTVSIASSYTWTRPFRDTPGPRNQLYRYVKNSINFQPQE